MLGTKTELRVIAATLLAAVIVATPLVGASASTTPYPLTVQFLSEKFINGRTLDGFTAGTPDYGFTIEAMLQLKAGGKKLTDQLVAVKANLADSTVLSRSIVSNYAYDANKKVKPGLAGKFLVASVAIGVPNAPLRNSVVSDLKNAISGNGVIESAAGNSFDYAWAILGLAAAGQTKLANIAAVRLASLERPDGGFGMDQTGDTLKSSPDATGIALQALALAKRSGTNGQIAIEQKALVSASKYLRSTELSGNHWESWGDVDVNGTAYAAMGLKAAGANISSIQDWLKSQLAPAGGLMTPWSNGSGDTFATAQGYVALLGLSYLNLLPVKK